MCVRLGERSESKKANNDKHIDDVDEHWYIRLMNLGGKTVSRTVYTNDANQVSPDISMLLNVCSYDQNICMN